MEILLFYKQMAAFFFFKICFHHFQLRSHCCHVWIEQSHRAAILRGLPHLKVSSSELVTPIVYLHQRQFGDSDASPESRPACLCQTNKPWQPVSPRRSSLAACSARVLSLNCLLFTTTKTHRCAIITIQTTCCLFLKNGASKKNWTKKRDQNNLPTRDRKSVV